MPYFSILLYNELRVMPKALADALIECRCIDKALFIVSIYWNYLTFSDHLAFLTFRPFLGVHEISIPLPVDTYTAIADFKGKGKGQVSFEEGDVVDVIDKNCNGKCGENVMCEGHT